MDAGKKLRDVSIINKDISGIPDTDMIDFLETFLKQF